MSKVEGGGVRLTPPSRLRVTIFSGRLLGLIEMIHVLIVTKLNDTKEEKIRQMTVKPQFNRFK